MKTARQDGAREHCITCRLNRGEEHGAPGGDIYKDDLWVLQHVMEPIPLVGWLVLKPFRHVEGFTELTQDEAASSGPLTRRIPRAMTEILHTEKIYLSLYAEAKDFQHLHVHLIPRFADTPLDRRGPNIFEFLADAVESGENQGDIQRTATVASGIREALARM